MTVEVLASQAFRLLVACADWPRSEERNTAIRTAAALLDGHWGAFIEQVSRHRMAPLALNGLTCAGVDPPPELVRQAERDKKSVLRIAAESRRVLEVLQENGIGAIVLKGPPLSQYLYDDPGMRQCRDLDILVSWHDFAEARRLLAGTGYQLQGAEPPWNDWRIGLWRKTAKDVTLLHTEHGITIELHHRLKTAEGLLPGLDMRDVRGRVWLAGMDFAIFGKADLFTYLAVHEATSLWHRLKWLADIRALLADCDEAEVGAIFCRAQELGVERCAALALLLCNRLWGQILPDRVLRLREQDAWLAELESRSLEVLADPDQRMRNFGQARVATSSLRLRDDWAYRRSALVTIIFDPDMVARLPLPRMAAILYVPARLVAWTKRRIGAR